MSDDTKYIPSSMTPATTTTPELMAKTVVTDNLTLGGTTVDKIISDWNITDPNVLLNNYAIKQGFYTLENIVSDAVDKINTLELTPVLSNPLLSPFFSDSNWVLDDFYIDLGKAMYVNNKDVIVRQAGLRIKNSAITSVGTHFFNVTIDRLDSGYITIVDQFSNILKTINIASNEKFEVEVLHPSTEYFDILVNEMGTGGVCIISSVYLHHVKDEFSEYSEYLTEKTISGGSELISKPEVEQLLQQNLEKANDYADTLVGMGNSNLGDHLIAVNPHNITTETIGAANVVHTHLPTEVGAAPSIHQHEIEDINNLEFRLNSVTDVSSHLTNFENPHNVTSDQVGLDLVKNYAPATNTEAISGVATDKYLTPSNLSAYVNNYMGLESGLVGNHQASLKVHTNISTNDIDGSTITFTVKHNTIYQIRIESDNPGINYLSIKSNHMSDTTTVYNSFNMSSQVLVDGTNVDLQRSYSETLNTFRLVPTGSGVNSGICMLTLDTANMGLTGNVLGRIATDTSPNTAGKIIPITIFSTVAVNQIEPDDIKTITIEYTDTSFTGKCDIFITELVPSFNDYAAIVDATPVGTVIEKYGTAPVPGYSRLDGSELSINVYSELYDLVYTNNLYIDISEYELEITNNGHCDKFGYDVLNMIIKLPTEMSSASLKNNYIKIDNISVPNQSQIIYNLEWV